MDKISTKIPTLPDTRRWDSSMINSIEMSDGMNWPLQSGHEVPQPIPDSVFVTSAPPIKIKSMPIVVMTANHFRLRCTD